MLSSFRPVDSQPNPTPNTVEKSVKSVKPKAPAPPPGSQLKPVKQPNTRQDASRTSVYTRQDTIEGVAQDPNPHIPEPDYWSEEDQDIERNIDLSTFKVNKTEDQTKRSDESQDPKSESNRMTQSFSENRTKNVANSAAVKQTTGTTVDNKPQLVSKEELRAQTQKIMSKSMSNTNERQSNNSNKSEKTVENCETTDSISESISKVRKNIREFERRSSACFETTSGVPAVVSIVMKKEANVTNSCNNSNNNNNNSIRVSKSCFEVDCCDNSSSGNQIFFYLGMNNSPFPK